MINLKEIMAKSKRNVCTKSPCPLDFTAKQFFKCSTNEFKIQEEDLEEDLEEEGDV